jgi:hypothetical protein
MHPRDRSPEGSPSHPRDSPAGANPEGRRHEHSPLSLLVSEPCLHSPVSLLVSEPRLHSPLSLLVSEPRVPAPLGNAPAGVPSGDNPLCIDAHC